MQDLAGLPPWACVVACGGRYDPRMQEREHGGPRFSRLGAVSDLGLEVRWRYAFVDAGESARTQRDAVYLDVGGRIEPGILDHHDRDGGGVAGSASRLVLERPDLVHEHLMARWIDQAERADLAGRVWRPMIVVHRRPDVDAFVSAVLVRRLVESGGVPREAKELAEYTDRIDQGDFELTRESGSTLLGLLAILQYADEDVIGRVDGREDGDLDERRMQIGMAIVEAWLLEAAAAGSTSPDRRRLPIRDRQELKPLKGLRVDELSSTYREWLREFEDLVVGSRDTWSLLEASVPGTNPPTSREATTRRGVVLGEAFFNASPLSLYFARAGICSSTLGKPDLIIEDRGRAWAGSNPAAKRYVISIRRDVQGEDGLTRRSTLRGLGLKLERLEQVERHARDRADLQEREGQTRFKEFPGIADPWYDGRDHGHSFVESPRHGSLLDFKQVVEVVKTAFWEPDLDEIFLRLYKIGTDKDEKVEIDSRDVDARGLRVVVDRAKSADYRIMQLKVHPAWNMQTIEDEIARFVGGRIGNFRLEGLDYIHGSRGLVCIVPHHLPSPRFEELADQMKPVWKMQRAVNAVHDGRRGSGGAADGACVDGVEDVKAEADRQIALDAGIIDAFVEETAKFRVAARAQGGERVGVRQHVMVGLDLETQIAATDRLLEHLDDRSEREATARINLVLVLLGALGLFEVLSSLLQHFESDADWTGVADVFWWTILGLTAVVVVAGFAAAWHDGFAKRLTRALGIRR